MIYIGIVGSRRRNTDKDKRLLLKEFHKISDKFGIEHIRIVSGGCEEGGDRFAEEIAKQFGVPILIHYPPVYKIDSKLPARIAYTKINHERNSWIAMDSYVLIALVAKDRKGGTEDTIKKFKKLKMEENLIII